MSTTEKNKRLVREALRPFEDGDSGPFFDLIADDVKWTVIGTTPASGVYRSKQEMFDRSIEPLMDRLEDGLKTKFVDMVGEGDKVFLRFEASGVAKTGMPYEQAFCWAMVMRDGRIVEIVDYLDTDLLRRIFA